MRLLSDFGLVLERAVCFLILGGILGGAIGLACGGSLGASQGVLLALGTGSNTLGTLLEPVAVMAMGAVIGGMIGGTLGAILGAVIFPVLQVWLLLRDPRQKNAPWDTYAGWRGGWRAGLLGSVAGAITGVIVQMIYMYAYLNIADMSQCFESAMEPLQGGFTVGSVVGFMPCMLAGVFIGGLGGVGHWINWPMRRLFGHIRERFDSDRLLEI